MKFTLFSFLKTVEMNNYKYVFHMKIHVGESKKMNLRLTMFSSHQCTRSQLVLWLVFSLCKWQMSTGEEKYFELLPKTAHTLCTGSTNV